MRDDNWELINGEPAHHIEQLNATNTVNIIEALMTLLIASNTVVGGLPIMPSEQALCELHRTSTIFLLREPGQYRTVPVVLKNQDGSIAYTPPPASEVPRLMNEFFDELRDVWSKGDALDVAAYALWRINWIHPFKNGNGRTARCFAYACLNARLGVIIPGRTTVIDQIMVSRDIYEACLRDADRTASGGQPNLKPMRAYLDGLLNVQINSIPDDVSP